MLFRSPPAFGPSGCGCLTGGDRFGSEFAADDPYDAGEEEVDEREEAELEEVEDDVGHGSGALEADLGAPDGDDVSVGQHVFAHAGAVDERAVRGSEVANCYRSVRFPDLRVSA